MVPKAKAHAAPSSSQGDGKGSGKEGKGSGKAAVTGQKQHGGWQPKCGRLVKAYMNDNWQRCDELCKAYYRDSGVVKSIVDGW